MKRMDGGIAAELPADGGPAICLRLPIISK
jgi:hypothetical protein